MQCVIITLKIKGRKGLYKTKNVHTFAARKRDSGIVLITSQTTQKIYFKIYFGKVKKVLTFAVPKQTGQKIRSDFWF